MSSYFATFQSAIVRVDLNGTWTLLDKTFSDMPPNAGANTNNTITHDDQRFLAFLGGNLLVGNDGGIYGLVNPTRVGSSNYPGRWISLNSNLRDTELYNAQFDPRNGQIFGGAQDNGVPVGGSPSGSPPGSWTFEPKGGSDGGPTAMGLDHEYYSVGNFGAYYYDPGIQLPAAPDNSGWVTNFSQAGAARPIGASPVLRGQLILGSNGGNVSGTVVSPKVYEISIPLLGQGIGPSDVTPSGMTGTLKAVAYGTNNPNAVYFGTNTGQLWYRSQPGASFAALPFWPVESGFSNALEIVVDPVDARTAYVLASNGHVLQTTDGGASWHDLTGDFGGSDKDLNSIARSFDTLTLVDPNPTQAGQGALVVGGLGGVYSLRLGSSAACWQRVGHDLPNVIVTDLHYVPGSDVLLASTYGRGAWVITSASYWMLNASVADITVTDDDASQNTIVIDSASGDPDCLKIMVNGLVEYLGPAASVGSITVRESGADDTVNVENNCLIPVTVNMGGGADTVNISQASQIYAIGMRPVTVHGGSGIDTLNVYDQKGVAGTDWSVTDTAITPSNRPLESNVIFDGLSAVNLYGGPGAGYTINGTSGRASGTTIHGGGGTNLFTWTLAKILSEKA
jgi:hypothetical protein